VQLGGASGRRRGHRRVNDGARAYRQGCADGQQQQRQQPSLFDTRIHSVQGGHRLRHIGPAQAPPTLPASRDVSGSAVAVASSNSRTPRSPADAFGRTGGASGHALLPLQFVGGGGGGGRAPLPHQVGGGAHAHPMGTPGRLRMPLTALWATLALPRLLMRLRHHASCAGRPPSPPPCCCSACTPGCNPTRPARRPPHPPLPPATPRLAHRRGGARDSEP